MCDKRLIKYRRASMKDLQNIRKFVDFWLSGRAMNKGIKNAGNDYFVSIGQQKSYLKNCIVLLAHYKNKIVGWAVKERTNVLIHLLVAADCRGMGIGKEMMSQLKPDIIRSKSDQQTGDPAPFYEMLGYKRISDVKVGKKKNIEFMSK